MKKVFIINGFPGAGKDTFVSYCKAFYCKDLLNIHTSNPMKMALHNLGWDGLTKSPEVRKALADLKKMSVELFDGSYEYIKTKIDNTECKVVFIHSREPDEIERFKREFNAQTILIDRDITGDFSNDSDSNVLNYTYDIIIDNNSSIQNLKESAELFVYTFIDKEGDRL